jgi:hypothetical protein
MAGEWIPLDCNLGTKPEVLELVDETGLPVEAVCWRLIQLWSWAALNSSDGTIRATPARLGAVAGGDEAFWLAVERVGWVTFSNGTLVINGWDKRFSRAAKARLEDARRKAEKRVENRNVRTLSEKCPEKNGLQERTVQERTEEAIQPAAPVATSDPPKRRKRSQPPDAVSWTADAGWAGITDADRQEWRLAYPACDLAAELAKATSWLRANPAKAHKSNWRRFLVSWLTRSQDRGGTHREPGRRPDEKPPPTAWRDEYRPAPYRSPKEVAALAAGMKLKEEDL